MDVLFLCYLFFVSSQDLIVGYFLLCLSIFFTLEACIYVCPFILGSNISTLCLSISVLLTLEEFDSASLISFTLDIFISLLGPV